MTIYGAVAVDEPGTIAATIWQRVFSPGRPLLVMLDVIVSTVEYLSEFLPEAMSRMSVLAQEAGLVKEQLPMALWAAHLAAMNPEMGWEPAWYADPAVEMMVAMNGMPTASMHPQLVMLPPEERDLAAATYTTARLVRMSAAVAEKVKQHPYNGVTRFAVGQDRNAVTDAYVLGVLVGLHEVRLMYRANRRRRRKET